MGEKHDWTDAGHPRTKCCLYVSCMELDSFPGLPHICSSVCIQYNTWKWKSIIHGSGRVLFHFNVLYWTQTEEQKWGRPGNARGKHGATYIASRQQAGVHWIWQLKNGTWVSIPACAGCDLTQQSETFDNWLWIMYFRRSFPVPSLKDLSAGFLQHQGAARPYCCTPDICHHTCLGSWRV